MRIKESTKKEAIIMLKMCVICMKPEDEVKLTKLEERIDESPTVAVDFHSLLLVIE